LNLFVVSEAFTKNRLTRLSGTAFHQQMIN
jgi:hypothetical protein